jgi:DnaJ-class molecular chaperone
MIDCDRCNGTGLNRHGTFYCPKCLGKGEPK